MCYIMSNTNTLAIISHVFFTGKAVSYLMILFRISELSVNAGIYGQELRIVGYEGRVFLH